MDLDEKIARRRRINSIYQLELKDLDGLSFQSEPDFAFSNRWLTTMFIDPASSGNITNEKLRLSLENENIEAVFMPANDEMYPSGASTWVDVEGLSDITLIEELGRLFNIHLLILEDVLNTHQRPKVEEYDDCIYLVAKAIELGEGEFSVEYQQISILLYDRFIFTFKERQDELF